MSVARGVPWAVAFVLAALLAPRKLQGPLMLLVALAYVGTDSVWALAVLLGTAAGSHLLLRARPGRVHLGIIIGATVALLVWARWGLKFGEESHLRLLGLSFYALRIIQVAVERVQGRAEPCSFVDYLHYLSFFPSFTAGPIHRLDDFLRDHRRRRWEADQTSRGLERVLFGAVKVVILGDWLVSRELAPLASVRHAQILLDAALVPDWMRSTVTPAMVRAYLSAWTTWANLYFQFAGRADIAVGLAAIVGYRLPENFAFPFLAPNVAVFWQRWHITLGTWCRDCVFQPIAAATRRPVLGLVASMIVIGLWHELSPRYVLWGVYHAAGLACWHVARRVMGPRPENRARWVDALFYGLAVLVTIHFVILSHVATTHLTARLRQLH